MFAENLVEHDGFLYEKDGNERRKGRPYCPRCHEAENKWIRIQRHTQRADYIGYCPQCNSEYEYDQALKDQLENGPTNQSVDHGPNDWMV